jgi:hypothetical protein
MDKMPCFVDYEELRLVYLDFSEMQTDVIPGFLEKCKDFVRNLPQKSVLFLVNAYHIDFTTKNIRDFTQFSKYNAYYAKATAVIGMDSVKQTLYNVALTLADRDKEKIQYFRNEEDGKAWLKYMSEKD